MGGNSQKTKAVTSIAIKRDATASLLCHSELGEYHEFMHETTGYWHTIHKNKYMRIPTNIPKMIALIKIFRMKWCPFVGVKSSSS